MATGTMSNDPLITSGISDDAGKREDPVDFIGAEPEVDRQTGLTSSVSAGTSVDDLPTVENYTPISEDLCAGEMGNVIDNLAKPDRNMKPVFFVDGDNKQAPEKNKSRMPDRCADSEPMSTRPESGSDELSTDFDRTTTDGERLVTDENPEIFSVANGVTGNDREAGGTKLELPKMPAAALVEETASAESDRAAAQSPGVGLENDVEDAVPVSVSKNDDGLQLSSSSRDVHGGVGETPGVADGVTSGDVRNGSDDVDCSSVPSNDTTACSDG